MYKYILSYSDNGRFRLLLLFQQRNFEETPLKCCSHVTSCRKDFSRVSFPLLSAVVTATYLVNGNVTFVKLTLILMMSSPVVNHFQKNAIFFVIFDFIIEGYIVNKVKCIYKLPSLYLQTIFNEFLL